jgi:hypothetical protein
MWQIVLPFSFHAGDLRKLREKFLQASSDTASLPPELAGCETIKWQCEK